MIRRIIEINEEKCNGCGLCAKACHEGAIGMVDGKAKLLRDDYCDGLGDCLPACPVDAIHFVEREALAYDEIAVKKNQTLKAHACSNECPVSKAKSISQETINHAPQTVIESQLSNWPIQIRLAPIQAPYFNDANLLIAADCTAFTYGNFHNEFMKNHITLVGCPKLDPVDYAEKLSEIIKSNNIKSVTLARMQVPCCGGLQSAILRALESCNQTIPVKIAIITPDGKII